MLKKILPWAIVALILFFIVRNPHSAADTARHLGSAVVSGANAVATFFTSLVK
jgi:hypothetical protein